MAIKFSDFGRARLTASIAAATAAPFTMSVDTGSRFSTYGASDFEYLVLKDASGNREAIKVTGRTGNSFTVAARALMGTTARDWAIGDLVEACLLSETMNSFMHLDGSKSMTGNLDFSGTGRRITGDMSNATRANRLNFQSSVVNGVTGLGVIPNGTATTSAFVANNSSDPDNSSRFSFGITSSRAEIISNATGTGANMPLAVNVNGTDVLTFATTLQTQINHLGTYLGVANGTTGYGALQLGNSSTGTNNWHFVSDGAGVLNTYQGTVGTGTLRCSDTSTVHNLQGREVSGVGKLSLSANAASFREISPPANSNTTIVISAQGAAGIGANLELTSGGLSYMDGTTHSWRSLDGTTTYGSISSSNMTINGEGFFNTNKTGAAYLQAANTHATGNIEIKAVVSNGTTTNSNIARFTLATPKANCYGLWDLLNNGASAPYTVFGTGVGVTGGCFYDHAKHVFRDQAGGVVFRWEGNGFEANVGLVAGTYDAASNPAVKTKKLTGTTSATAGGVVNIAHGLADATKIVGISVLIKPGGLDIYPPGDSIRSLGGPTPSVNYTYWIGLFNVSVQTASNANSEILGKPVTIWITYEA